MKFPKKHLFPRPKWCTCIQSDSLKSINTSNTSLVLRVKYVQSCSPARRTELHLGKPNTGALGIQQKTSGTDLAPLRCIKVGHFEHKWTAFTISSVHVESRTLIPECLVSWCRREWPGFESPTLQLVALNIGLKQKGTLVQKELRCLPPPHPSVPNQYHTSALMAWSIFSLPSAQEQPSQKRLH